MAERALEASIKSTVINHLISKQVITKQETLINEFTVGNFSRRVDLAVIKEDESLAFEIKSEADSLTRLDGQVATYLKYFDKVTVVATPKHIPEVLNSVPSTVAVWELSKGKLKIKQRGKKTKVKEKSQYLDLMTAVELAKTAQALNYDIATKKRDALVQKLTQAPISKLRKFALKSIRERYQSTSKAFLTSVANRLANPEDLILLSPYKTIDAPHKDASIESFIQQLTMLEASISSNVTNKEPYSIV